jgi:putative protease
MVTRKKIIKKKAVRKAVKKVKKTVRKALKSKAKVKVNGVKAKGKAKVSKAPELSLEKIGVVTHYFPHVNAAAVKLGKGGVTVGDKIYIKGHTTDFKENVRSIQLDHKAITVGKKGQEIGLFVKSRVRIGDKIYKI